MFARLVAKGAPILLPIPAHVTHGNNCNQCVLFMGSHGWIKTGRGVDVKTGIGGQTQITNDAGKVLAIVGGEEKSVRAKSLKSFIQTPKETDHRTRIAFMGESFCLSILREQMLIHVG